MGRPDTIAPSERATAAAAATARRTTRTRRHREGAGGGGADGTGTASGAGAIDASGRGGGSNAGGDSISEAPQREHARDPSGFSSPQVEHVTAHRRLAGTPRVGGSNCRVKVRTRGAQAAGETASEAVVPASIPSHHVARSGSTVAGIRRPRVAANVTAPRNMTPATREG